MSGGRTKRHHGQGQAGFRATEAPSPSGTGLWLAVGEPHFDELSEVGSASPEECDLY